MREGGRERGREREGGREGGREGEGTHVRKIGHDSHKIVSVDLHYPLRVSYRNPPPTPARFPPLRVPG